MRTDWTLVEACSGGAALTLWLCGVKRRPVPYFGSKWSIRRELAGMLPSLGFVGPPSRVVLCDPGPWPETLAALFEGEAARNAIVEHIESLNGADPAEVFASLSGSPVPSDPHRRAAEHLWLQRLSFGAKPIGSKDGTWKTHGISKTDAYGNPPTERFGSQYPMGPRLVLALQHGWPPNANALVFTEAEASRALEHASSEALVYIDPPYAGATGYPDGTLSRSDVIALAGSSAKAGASVVVSEGEPVRIAGFDSKLIKRIGKPGSKSKPRKEWVTYCRGQ